MMAKSITMDRESRDNIRAFISTEAKQAARDAFPEYGNVRADRDTVLTALERSRQWLSLLDRIGWEVYGQADEYEFEFTDTERELLIGLEPLVLATFEDDHRADDKAVLDAVRSLKAVA